MRAMDLFYRALNVPMRAFLRSPFHGGMSRNLCLLTYRGRRSGKPFTIPLSYVQDGDVVRLLSSDQTRWWKNFLGEGANVELTLRGKAYRGHAQSVVEDGDRLRGGVRRFLTALPRDAVVYGIKLDGDRKPREQDVETAAGHVTLVEITLES